MRVAILHYSAPPVVGGVEHTIAHHAVGLADHGHDITIVAGVGEAFDPRVRLQVIPLLYSQHPRILGTKRSLDQGTVPAEFARLVEEISSQLAPALSKVETVIAHNILSLHKNLALTTALHSQLASGAVRRLIGWHHDLAWDRADLRAEVHPGTPADLLHRAWPGVVNVAVSDSTRQRLAALYGCPADAIRVVPAGVDPQELEGWTQEATRIFTEHNLHTADAVLLQPVRITRRKNLELALRILAALRSQSGRDIRLVVTGPLGAHNPDNQNYLEELVRLREVLGLSQAAHFVAAEGGLEERTLVCLYRACDALLLTSVEEGFGMPVLEAALARLPVFCTDLPSLAETGGDDVHRFALSLSAEEIAIGIAARLFSDPAYRLHVRVRRRYSWEAVIQTGLLPLVEG